MALKPERITYFRDGTLAVDSTASYGAGSLLEIGADGIKECGDVSKAIGIALNSSEVDVENGNATYVTIPVKLVLYNDDDEPSSVLKDVTFNEGDPVYWSTTHKYWTPTDDDTTNVVFGRVLVGGDASAGDSVTILFFNMA